MNTGAIQGAAAYRPEAAEPARTGQTDPERDIWALEEEEEKSAAAIIERLLKQMKEAEKQFAKLKMVKRPQKSASMIRRMMLMMIISKLARGDRLSSGEKVMLKQEHPALYSKAVKVERERKRLERELKRCKTKEEAQRKYRAASSRIAAECAGAAGAASAVGAPAGLSGAAGGGPVSMAGASAAGSVSAPAVAAGGATASTAGTAAPGAVAPGGEAAAVSPAEPSGLSTVANGAASEAAAQAQTGEAEMEGPPPSAASGAALATNALASENPDRNPQQEQQRRGYAYQAHHSSNQGSDVYLDALIKGPLFEMAAARREWQEFKASARYRRLEREAIEAAREGRRQKDIYV